MPRGRVPVWPRCPPMWSPPHTEPVPGRDLLVQVLCAGLPAHWLRRWTWSTIMPQSINLPERFGDRSASQSQKNSMGEMSSYCPRVTFFDFPQLSGMQIYGRVGLAFAVGNPEESQFKVRAPEGDKAKESEQHGINKECHVLQSELAGLFQAVKHHHGHDHH